MAVNQLAWRFLDNYRLFRRHLEKSIVIRRVVRFRTRTTTLSTNCHKCVLLSTESDVRFWQSSRLLRYDRVMDNISWSIIFWIIHVLTIRFLPHQKHSLHYKDQPINIVYGNILPSLWETSKRTHALCRKNAAFLKLNQMWFKRLISNTYVFIVWHKIMSLTVDEQLKGKLNN